MKSKYEEVIGFVKTSNKLVPDSFGFDNFSDCFKISKVFQINKDHIRGYK